MRIGDVGDPTPNFLYIGTSKAGSTWLFNVLAKHPEVYVAASKGAYYFDQHFDEGSDWYMRHFAGAAGESAIGEISHSYLSSPSAPPRIAEFNPKMRLLVSLREPVDRAFSDYLDLVKNAQFEGPFATALERFPRLLDRGRYATHLQRYLDLFPAEQLHVRMFDSLGTDAQGYADDVCRFLGVRQFALPPAALKRRMPAATPRNARAAAVARSASGFARRAGLKRLRSGVKRSRLVRQALYRPYTSDKPTIEPELAADLHRHFQPEVIELDRLLGGDIAERWGYR